jgi:hypothetical protein
VSRERQLSIDRLRDENVRLEDSAARAAETWSDRLKALREQHADEVARLHREMEDQKAEHDLSLSRFMEQKAQLEEHVKAFHRVFLEFNSDSVYLTLEDMKQKQSSLEKKVRARDKEIARLNSRISDLEFAIEKGEELRETLELSIDELRRKLRVSMALTNRLQRRLDMRSMDEGALGPPADLEDDGDLGPPLISPEVVLASTLPRRARAPPFDPAPFLQLFQKLVRVEEQLRDYVQRGAARDDAFANEAAEELGRALLLADLRFVLSVIEERVDAVGKYSAALEAAGFDGAAPGRKILVAPEPRFLQFIARHDKDAQAGAPGPGVALTVRRIFQSKRMSDLWHRRIGKPVMRFPEFVVAWHCKDGESLFAALQRCARLYRAITNTKRTEFKIFKWCLTEKFFVDELSFFLELRESLVGTTAAADPAPIRVQYRTCQAVMENLLGRFLPIVQIVSGEAEKRVDNGTIDYADFAIVIMQFYRNERRKRRNAVRLMFQSRKFTGNSRDRSTKCWTSSARHSSSQAPR